MNQLCDAGYVHDWKFVDRAIYNGREVIVLGGTFECKCCVFVADGIDRLLEESK